MKTLNIFRDQYEALEERLRKRAEKDGAMYMPNPRPSSPADFIFICMEPALGGRTPEAARSRIEDGALNFVNSMEDFLLHYAARRYLCDPGERYFITDLSKGAMPVQEAQSERAARYDRWFPLLMQEIGLVAAPGAHLFAVGKAVADYLGGHELGYSPTPILHYSPQASAHRQHAVEGREEEFDQFRRRVATEDVLAVATGILEASGAPVSIQNKTLSALDGGKGLTASRKKLLFTYKTTFESAFRED